MAATATARRAPAPAHHLPRRHLIPIAVGTATAVRNLPDSGLIVRMTRGRAWIAVLGVLLAGIVTLNVITLSLAAGEGHVGENVQALEEENGVLRSRDAERSGVARVRHEAAGLGLGTAPVDEVEYVRAGQDDVARAASRLAGAY